MHSAIYKLSFPDSTIWQGLFALAIQVAIFPLSFFDSTMIWPGYFSLAIQVAIFELSFIDLIWRGYFS